MIVIRLLGGLGNQMFQFAFARSLSINLNNPLKIDLSLLKSAQEDDAFTPRDLDLDIFSAPLDMLDPCHDFDAGKDTPIYSIAERKYTYDEELVDYINMLEGTLMINGYWQSYKYFERYRKEISSDFCLKDPLRDRWKQLQKLILHSQSVMVNVRRGDYLYPQKINYHGVVTRDYLEKAMEIIKCKVEDPLFFIFSDDMEWCRNNIAGQNIFFVDESYYDKKYQYYFQLMTDCKHFILANSSFAWWAAYLSGNKGIVIGPKDWFKVPIDTKDLTPDSWIRI